MKTYYALVERGRFYAYSGGSSFRGRDSFMRTEAENRTQAFLQIYLELRKHNSDITALKTRQQDQMLGFTVEEWKEISKKDIHITDGYPKKAGVQIRAIGDSPYKLN